MNFKKGFTLIELLVVVAIIGILVSVILASLNNSKAKTNDAKIQSQLKSMVSQAQLFGGADSAYVASVVFTPSTIDGAAAGGTLTKGILFNNTTSSSNSLYTLMSKLPSGTNLYYGWDGSSVLTGGKWFVAASGSKGAYCVDYTSFLKTYNGSVPSDVAGFNAAFSNLGSYSCK
jgi:prepilin-type N-terminal cleavage/methylation domain-containing protein